MKPFKYNVMKSDFLDTKKSRDYVICILIACILVIPRGCPRNVRDTYVSIKLQKDMQYL